MCEARKVVKWAGPVTLVAFLFLALSDLMTMFFWSEMCWYSDDDYILLFPFWNMCNTFWTFFWGLWLTISGCRERPRTAALLAWIILDAMLVASYYGAFIWYLIFLICIPTLYAFQIVWGTIIQKSCLYNQT